MNGFQINLEITKKRVIDLLQVDVGDMIFVIHEIPKPAACSKVFLMRITAYALAHLNFQIFAVFLKHIQQRIIPHLKTEKGVSYFFGGYDGFTVGYFPVVLRKGCPEIIQQTVQFLCRSRFPDSASGSGIPFRRINLAL
jgi:hypothetical protein